jgi:CysZ protein
VKCDISTILLAVEIPTDKIVIGSKFFDGVALFWRGTVMALKRPQLYLLGLIPAAIAFAILAIGVGLAVALLGPETAALTWFASGWQPWARTTAQIVAGAALVGLALLVSMWLFTALALAIGDPFYEKISHRVDDEADTPAGNDDPLISAVWEGLKDSLRIGTLAAFGGLGLFVVEFFPLIGQIAAPILGALFGGWILMLELSGTPFGRRGQNLSQRRQVLRRHRPLVLGLGTMTFVMFLIPLGAVLFMPAAVVSATLLAQRLTALDAAAPQAKLTSSR